MMMLLLQDNESNYIHAVCLCSFTSIFNNSNHLLKYVLVMFLLSYCICLPWPTYEKHQLTLQRYIPKTLKKPFLLLVDNLYFLVCYHLFFHLNSLTTSYESMPTTTCLLIWKHNYFFFFIC